MPAKKWRRPSAHDLAVEDPEMERVADLVGLVARGDINVLVSGETGVGKEVVAHAIHDASPRASHPFVAFNCAALTETLFESELFGYERGAFTGALTAKVGLLEAADGGTVFLDEIGELPLPVQAKLLRAIERREVRRIGTTTPVHIDVRFIAATHQDLERAIEEGRFREDLFYRLNGVAIVVPPLRLRPRSIRVLAERFLAEAAVRLQRPGLELSDEAAQALIDHNWPGNVRELRNVMDRAVLLSMGGTILPEHVQLDARANRTISGVMRAVTPPVAPVVSPADSPSGENLDRELADLERKRILDALDQCGGNQTLAAKRLGISRRRLIDRLEDYGVPRPRKRQ
jgi:transcriptional regulator with PAS, ATPase and Fis domain